MGKKMRRAATPAREERDPRGIEQYVDDGRAPVMKSFHLQPKTERQNDFIQAINHNEIVVADAPAGCGKTYIAGNMAAKFLAEGDVDRILLTRANVHRGKSLGMLPGTLEDKMEPLLAPILAVLKGRMGERMYAYNRAKKKIDIQAIEYVRGNSYKDTFLIVDEAQNLEIDDIQALVTRYESGRILLLGDPFQTDIKGENGLVWLEKFAARNKLNYPIIKFTLDDIVRSDLVKQFLKALYAEKGIKC